MVTGAVSEAEGDGERGDERILGDGDFVHRILKDAEEKTSDS